MKNEVIHTLYQYTEGAFMHLSFEQFHYQVSGSDALRNFMVFVGLWVTLKDGVPMLAEDE